MYKIKTNLVVYCLAYFLPVRMSEIGVYPLERGYKWTLVITEQKTDDIKFVKTVKT